MTNDTFTSIKDILSVNTQDTHTLPLVFDSPHSGTFYPEDFEYACDINELRKLEDAHIDDLFSTAPQYNAALLCATFARSYIDPNRGIDDIDEQMLKSPWPEYHFGALAPTERSEQGIGLIARDVRKEMPIYKRKLSIDEVSHRISNYYVPYHKTLEKILNKAHKRHGQVWHINLHSMPSSLAYPKRKNEPYRKHATPCASDIVLGDLDGYCCEPSFVQVIQNFWEELGYNVSINDPFKGAEIIANYGHPEEGRNSLQMEINRSLYMNEATGKPTGAYQRFKEHCTQMIAFCAHYCEKQLNNNISTKHN